MLLRNVLHRYRRLQMAKKYKSSDRAKLLQTHLTEVYSPVVLEEIMTVNRLRKTNEVSSISFKHYICSF